MAFQMHPLPKYTGRMSLLIQEPRKRNCISAGVSDSIALSSALTVEWIMLVFFSWISTIRLSTESSMQRRVMVHGRVWPMRWHRSADCHSAAGFHHLHNGQSKLQGRNRKTYGSTMKTREASVRFSATPPALSETRKHSTSTLFMKCSIEACR